MSKQNRTNHRWIIKSHGVPKYYAIYLPEHPHCRSDGSILEHRYIMEKKIGRYLTSKEVIHHIDGNGLNNGINNLELFSTPEEHNSHRHAQYQGWFEKGQTPWNKGNATFNCVSCKRKFRCPPSQVKRRKACSHECKWNYLNSKR